MLSKISLTKRRWIFIENKKKLTRETKRAFFRNRNYENVLSSGVLDAGEQGAKWQDKRKAKGLSTEFTRPHLKKIADHLEKVVKNTGSTAKNTKNSGATLPAETSSTSGTGH